MKKLVKIKESDLKRIAKKVIKEDDNMDYEMKGAEHRRGFTPTPREEDVMSIFGDFYGEDVPPVVIRYMRKNPDAILRRMSKIYPDIYMRHIPAEGPLDEAKQVTSTQYDLGNAQDVADFNRDKRNVTDVDKIKVGQNMAQIDEDGNPFADIPTWKGRGRK